VVLREQDKHFLSSLYAAIAVIFAWKGIWEGIYEIPYSDPFIFLFIGFAMLTLSGAIFKEFDPLGGVEKAVNKTMRSIFRHPEKEKFKLHYYDKNLHKNIVIDAKRIKDVEKDAIIVMQEDGKGEIFIPFHRIKSVYYKGKEYWRL